MELLSIFMTGRMDNQTIVSGNSTDGEACVHLRFYSNTLRWNDMHCLADRYIYGGVLYHMGGYVCKKRKPPQI